ncbi:MAG: hypothetical protein LBB53_00290 [Prevotellaceae bacterium]|nr:hypothetical protein [Prevotellaceae bacterium]
MKQKEVFYPSFQKHEVCECNSNKSATYFAEEVFDARLQKWGFNEWNAGRIKTIFFNQEVILSPETITAIVRQLMLEMQLKDSEMPVYVSQNKAYKRYGTARVKRWLFAGKVRQNTSGGKIDLRYEDLEKCAAKEDFIHGVMEKRKYNKKTN